MSKLKKVLFYISSCTWGIIMTFIGACIAFGCVCAGKKPNIFNGMVHFRFGKNWGGVEMGLFFFTDDTAGLHTMQHESGHGLQNALWGPLFPFLVALPSGLRYNMRNFRTYQTKTTFCSILFTVLFALLITLLSVTFTYLPIHILFGLLLVYAVILCGWMFGKELPQYKNNKYVDYDAIWFEGQASRWGEWLYNELNK